MEMIENEFERVKEQFANADTDGKVDIYVSTQGLTQAQYRELLKLFPYSEIHKLEKALS